MAVISVSQLNRYVKSLLEGDTRLAAVYIRGEISNFKNNYSSGHLYLTLKDEEAAVDAVMFRGNASRLRFRPENGMTVLVRARISLYERTGRYQLYIDDMQPDGIGALTLAFEQRKKQLAAEGLFDEERKRPLPPYPMRVGVITSPTGAAVRDILNVLGRRWPLARVVFCPVAVQGDAAAPQIAQAIERFDAAAAADVLIVGRGGGSLEDLWAFNEEVAVRAVAACRIPVISAVGHETDFTLCDFAADLRAPTPSAAAELAVPDRQRVLAAVQTLSARLRTAQRARLDRGRQALLLLRRHRCLSQPGFFVDEQRMRLDRAARRFAAAARQTTAAADRRLSACAAKLDALSPLKVLSRGYAIGYAPDGSVLTSVHGARPGDEVRLRLSDGTLSCRVTQTEEVTG